MKHQTSPSPAVRAAARLAYATLFLLPLAYLPGFIFAFSSSKFVFFAGASIVLAGLTAWILYCRPALARGMIRDKFFLGAALLYLAVYMAAALHGVNPGFSFWGSLERGTGGLSVILLFCFLVSVYALGRLGGKRFLHGAMLGSFLGAVVLVLMVTLSPDGLEIWRGPFIVSAAGGGLLGNSSLAGAYALFNVFFGVILFARHKSRGARFWIALGMLAILASPLFIDFHYWGGLEGLIGTARGAAIGIIFGAFAALAAYWCFGRRKSVRMAGIALGILLAVLAAFGFIRLVNPDSRLHAEFTQSATDTRFRFWHAAGEAIRTRPVFGWGPENFDFVFHRYFDPGAIVSEQNTDIVLDRPHNTILQVATDGGYLLLLSFLALLVAVALALVRAVRRGGLTRLEGAALLGLLAGWFLQDQFVFDSLASLALLFFLAGVALAYSRLPDEVEMFRSKQKGSGLVGAAIVALAAAGLVYFSILPGAKAHAMKKIYNLPYGEQAKSWDALGGVSPIGNNSDTAFFGGQLYQKIVADLQNIRTGTPENRQAAAADIEAGIAHFKKIVAPSGPARGNYRLTLLVPRYYLLDFVIQGSLTGAQFSDAEAYFNDAIALAPRDPEAYWTAGQLYLAEKKPDQAKAALASAAALEPQIPETYRIMLNISLVTGDQKYYNDTLGQARAAIPGFEP